ncbi:hypothetical protein Q7P35_005169 [Cladosporium inversicolor]
MRIFDVFHTKLLRPAANDPMPGQRILPPPPVIVERPNNEAQQEWEVEAVVDSRRKRNKLHYTVKWVGHEDTTEQPWIDLLPGSEVSVARFHQKHPNKPGLPSSFKAELDLQMMGSAVAIPAMNVGVPAIVATVLEPEPSSSDGPFCPLTYVVSTSANMEPQDHHDPPIPFAQGDLWLLDVAGALLWMEGGIVSRGDITSTAQQRGTERPRLPSVENLGKSSYKTSISPSDPS